MKYFLENVWLHPNIVFLKISDNFVWNLKQLKFLIFIVFSSKQSLLDYLISLMEMLCLTENAQ